MYCYNDQNRQLMKGPLNVPHFACSAGPVHGQPVESPGRLRKTARGQDQRQAWYAVCTEYHLLKIEKLNKKKYMQKRSFMCS